MTHTYKISGMTCTSCQAKVQHLLSKVNGVQHVDVDLLKGEASIDMNFHIPAKELQGALKNYPKYQLSGPDGRSNAPVLAPYLTCR